MSRRTRICTPAIVRIFGTALDARWDDDALRLGAALACYTLFAVAPVLFVGANTSVAPRSRVVVTHR
jgi:uncharacterized BrkB/YihY/UPF0761 family membrane protein